MENNSTQQKSFLIKDTSTNILKPITEQVAFKLLDYLNVIHYFKDKRTYNLYYYDDLSSLSKLKDDNYKAKVIHNRADIIVEPILNPKDIKDVIFNYNNDFIFGNDRFTVSDMFIIFNDNRYSIKLLEYCIPTALKLSFNLRIRSSEIKDIITSSLYTKFSLSKINKYHDIAYQYELPNYLLVMMYKLYKMRNDGLKFKDYIKIGSNNSVIVNYDKTQFDQFQLYIDKVNLMCLGNLEYDFGIPDKEKTNKVTDRYDIKFTYTIQFSKPQILQLNYPLIIKNQIIPKELIYEDKLDSKLSNSANNSENMDISYNHPYKSFNLAYNQSSKNIKDLTNKYKTIRYPREDKLISIRSPLHTRNLIIFQGILNVDKTIGGTPFITIDLINEIFPLMKDYHDVKVLEDVLKLEKEDSKSIYSLISICIFQNDNLVDKGSYTISDNLNIRLDNVDIDSIYRIIITLNLNLHFVNKDQIYKAIEHNKYFDKLLIVNLSKLENDGYITTKHLDRINPEITTYINKQVYPGTIITGENIYGSYSPFRLGNVIIYPKRFSY